MVLLWALSRSLPWGQGELGGKAHLSPSMHKFNDECIYTSAELSRSPQDSVLSEYLSYSYSSRYVNVCTNRSTEPPVSCCGNLKSPSSASAAAMLQGHEPQSNTMRICSFVEEFPCLTQLSHMSSKHIPDDPFYNLQRFAAQQVQRLQILPWRQRRLYYELFEFSP
jgi:hypothetical protein